MARPSVLENAAAVKAFLDVIELGHTIRAGAAIAGWETATVYNLLRKGARRKRGKERAFYLAFKRAQGNAERMHTNVLLTAAPTDWKASLTILRRLNKEWMEKSQVKVEGHLVGRTELHALFQEMAQAAIAVLPEEYLPKLADAWEPIFRSIAPEQQALPARRTRKNKHRADEVRPDGPPQLPSGSG